MTEPSNGRRSDDVTSCIYCKLDIRTQFCGQRFMLFPTIIGSLIHIILLEKLLEFR